MNVYECVVSLSSVRSYLNKGVSDEIIMEVMESGRMSPSARNNQPWEFVLIRKKEILKGLGKYCTSGNFITQAAFAVALVTDPSSKWHQIDGTRAAQNMVLAAWSHGLGSCWIGAMDKEGLKTYLKVPEELDILTVLPFGYFDEDSFVFGKARKSPDKVYHLDNYGERFAG